MKIFFAILSFFTFAASAQTDFARLKPSSKTFVFKDIVEFDNKAFVGSVTYNNELILYPRDHEKQILDLLCREIGYGKSLGPGYFWNAEPIENNRQYLSRNGEFVSGFELKKTITTAPDDRFEPLTQSLRGLFCEKTLTSLQQTPLAGIHVETPTQLVPKISFMWAKEFNGVVIFPYAQMSTNFRPSVDGGEYTTAYFHPSYGTQLADKLCQRMGYKKNVSQDLVGNVSSQLYDFRIYVGPDGNFMWGIDLKKLIPANQMGEQPRMIGQIVCEKN